MTALKTIRLADYQPPAFTVKHHELKFELQNHGEVVVSHVQKIVRSQPSHDESGWELPQDKHVALHAEHLAFDLIEIDGKALTAEDYNYDGARLLLKNVADSFNLHTVVRLKPDDNKELSGLYRSNGIYCTQCEAEGFRRITPTLDRPDVLATYRVRIEADQKTCPVLLSNGNPEGQGELPGGRHYAQWYDPHPKPSYLFALVAGNLAQVSRRITTPKGKKISLNLYTEPAFINQTAFAMQSLIDAIHWDEERFSLSYDLEQFNIVAISDFNMGAMENKSLNIFNTRFVLADTDTATDEDYHGIRAVIGHEYFHNWTGNRVTCRDWFQLSLKEGLTVFRDQEFSADRASREVRRIENVSFLRAHQFPEDAGPTAHPVRPASYVEMNNFYTLTVYEKGAEVVRMYHTFLGEEGFQKGMKLYFQRHDGQAVTCDDFRAAMADANGFDFEQFALWYSQAGTPVLDVSGSLQADNRFVLNIRQSIPPTPDMAAKQPMMIPLKIALFSADEDTFGQPVPFKLPENGHTQTEAVLTLRQAEESVALQFEGDYQQVVPSLLRGFSAPVNLHYAYSGHELSVLLACDSDPFARWEAAQTLYRRAIAANEAALLSGSPLPEHRALLQAIDYVLRADIGAAFQAALLAIPNEAELWAGRQNIDPLIVHRAREALLDLVATHFADQFAALNAEARRMEEEQSGLTEPYEYHPQQAGWRALRNACRAFILRARPGHIEQVAANYSQMAHNMTHEWGILSAINHNERPERNRLLEQFAAKFHSDDLVMCKYFSLIAASHRADTPEQVAAALKHPAFSLENPNKARALLGSFSRNVPHFHAADGSGYAFLANQIGCIDRFNPQIAARLAQAFNICAQLEPQRRSLMRAELQKLAANPALSKDSGEIIGKILQASA